MTKFALLGVVAILLAIGTPSLAETTVQELGAYAAPHQDGTSGIASTSIPSSRRGLETSTKPWSAPVGHRQPRAADVPISTSQQSFDEEDANVDRKINSICRGC